MELLSDVLLGDPIDFDPVVFRCWLDGLDAAKVVSVKSGSNEARAASSRSLSSPKQKRILGPGPGDIDEEDQKLLLSSPQAVELMRCEVVDQYRSYDLLVHYIRSPQLLSEQTMIWMTRWCGSSLAENYRKIEKI